MRRDLINKIIAGTIISTTLCTLVPVRASAEWTSDYQNNWYYTQDGQKMTGWKNINNKLYYFDGNGKMQTGWLKAENSYYFLQNDGVLKTGWFKYDRNWYYSDLNGLVQTGNINIAGKVYIFDNNGIMKTNNTVINGEFYTIGSDGAVAGAKTPTPDKEFDKDGKLLEVFKNTDSKDSISPTYSSYSDVVKDQSVSDEDPNEGRTFKVRFKDSNGAELKVKSIKNGKKVDLYAPTKDGYVFGSWNTKSDGSGKSYSSSDDFKVKEDANLYAQWTTDNAVYVDGITIKGSSYVTVNKTTQMTAEISPSDATNKGVKWSVTDGTGKASIDSNGVLTGTTAGTVTVKATAQDKSQYSVSKEVTVSTVDVTVPVSKISIGSKTGSFAITASGGTLQMTAKVYPDNANNQDVTWSVDNIGGSASIDPKTGLVTAISNGVVTVKATAQDGSGKVGSTTINISGQSLKIPVTSVEISAKGGVNKITTDAALGEPSGTLQMNASVLPATASNKAIVWRIINGSDYANISSSTGLITAKGNGTVTVQATVVETGMASNKVDIDITGQSIKVTEIEVNHSGTALDNDKAISGDTEFSITTTPALASYKEVKWVVENQTGSAEFKVGTGEKAMLTPNSNGKVLVKAIATAIDGTTVSDTQLVEIQSINKTIYVTRIDKVEGKDATGKSVTSITKDDGTLEMHADIYPGWANTTGAAVTWKVISGSAAIITGTNTLQAVSDTTKAGSVPVVVRATCIGEGGKLITKDTTIYISNQFIQATSIGITPTGTPQVAVGGTLQMSATVGDSDATYKNVQWNVEGGSGTADIDANGLLTGKSKGTVTVVATADNGIATAKQATQTVTVVAPTPVSGIKVKTPDGSNDEIKTSNGTLQMSVETITPDTATNKNVKWLVVQAGEGDPECTGKATITDKGVLTAVANGIVKVKATAQDGSNIVSNIIPITINQPIKATSLTLKGYSITGGVIGASANNEIAIDDGMLQLIPTLAPTNATTTPASVIWTVSAGNAGFTIDNGVTSKPTVTTTGTNGATLKALTDGNITVTATGTFADGTQAIVGTYPVAIKWQVVKATGIKIDTPSAPIPKGTKVTLTAKITPAEATTQKIKWKIVTESGTGIGTATIGEFDGVFMGITPGVVNIEASVVDDAGNVIVPATNSPVNVS